MPQPIDATDTAILSALERRATLIGWGVDRWDLQALHPNVKLRLTRPWPSQFPGEVVKLGRHG